MEELSKKNSQGSVARLYVNPDDPNQSRLADDLNPFNLLNMMFMGMGGLFALLGLKEMLKGIGGQPS
jgi:hypothetical protein